VRCEPGLRRFRGWIFTAGGSRFSLKRAKVPRVLQLGNTFRMLPPIKNPHFSLHSRNAPYISLSPPADGLRRDSPKRRNRNAHLQFDVTNVEAIEEIVFL
jgi:hypothetical protein